MFEFCHNILVVDVVAQFQLVLSHPTIYITNLCGVFFFLSQVNWGYTREGKCNFHSIFKRSIFFTCGAIILHFTFVTIQRHKHTHTHLTKSMEKLRNSLLKIETLHGGMPLLEVVMVASCDFSTFSNFFIFLFIIF